MKKVLIIGYFRPYFHYGSARVPGLAHYLREFGWQPVILTPLEMQPPADDRFRIVQTP
ncbi:glycosyl transferase GT4 family protein, partial [Candidatus Kaiserbacteria bacterium]|nr:glycosyl transferase GT4 family protein [Candidatus Kaiserbacteria bacterium]